MRRIAIAAAVLLLSTPATAKAEQRGVDLVPVVTNGLSSLTCIPFGDNVHFGFTGMIYRNVPPFRMRRGDGIAFDLAAPTGEDARREIWFAVAAHNPQELLYGGRRVPNVWTLGWLKVVSDSQVPRNPRGNGVIGDYELEYRAEADFDFPGGGLIVGFSGSPPGGYADPGCDRDRVGVTTYIGDQSRLFYARFFRAPHLSLGLIDLFEDLPRRFAFADTFSLWGMRVIPRPAFEITVRTFIPGNYAPGPPWNLCRPDRGRPQRLYYAGDDGGFDANATAYRTEQNVTLVADAASDADGLADGTGPLNDTGTTYGYAGDALEDGRIDGADDDGVLGDCHLLHAVGKATTEDMRIAVNRVGPKQVLARFVGHAANPLVFTPDPSFGISWDLTVTVNAQGEKPQVTVLGDHDGFPAYEVFVNDVRVYGWEPVPFPYSFVDTLALLPPMEVPVEVAGELP
jgi:hypothetical protein